MTLGELPASGAGTASTRLGPAFLVCCHIVVCCLSLVYISERYSDFHIFFDEKNLYDACLGVALLSMIVIFFTAADFSFGYFVTFYLYTVTIGYTWLSFFSKFNYDLVLARFSACASLLALLLPALLITSPLPRVYELPRKLFKQLPVAILILAAVIIGMGATFGFRIVGLAEMYKFQREIAYPTWMNYVIGTVTTVLLPFAFACFLARAARWGAGLCLLASLLFYPITLNKLTLFTPAWLVFVALLLRFFSERSTVILSLFIPASMGIILLLLFGTSATTFFGTVNFRMLAIPSSALDIYNDYFARHSLTYFCQISFLKFQNCPYQVQLSLVMAQEYRIGNFNASLLATEGIASVGPRFAPVSALICGLIIALGNRLSAGLPPSFILLSSSILAQVLLNVPLSTTLLTHGAALLYLLWYLAPREFFQQNGLNNTLTVAPLPPHPVPP